MPVLKIARTASLVSEFLLSEGLLSASTGTERTVLNCASSLQQTNWGLGAHVSCRSAFAFSLALRDNVN